jgi:formylglycine-generating enzyme required for sulfatase activity
MITMKGGKFLMGAGQAVEGGPEHNIELSGFQLSKVPITNRQFRQFVEAENYKTDAEKKPTAFEIEHGHITWRTFAEGRDDYPVVWISWNDANNYCQWLNKVAPSLSEEEDDYSDEGAVSSQVNEPYRLPTEAEWEFAARGGLEHKPYPWGDKADPEILNCNWDTRPDTVEAARKYLKPVGQQQANTFGLQDMAGNIGQWCYDWYDPQYYQSSPARNPIGPEKGKELSARGGSWFSSASECQVASRQHFASDERNAHTGFRVARSLPRKIVVEEDSDQ